MAKQDALKRELERHLLEQQWEPARRNEWLAQIQHDVAGRTDLGGGLNFTRLSSRILWQLFEAYDREFFMGRTRDLVEQHQGRLDFRLSKRMTRTGGKTTRQEFYRPTPEGLLATFEITISSTLLFQAFRGNQPTEVVSGVRCSNRMEALQRIFEHEMLHLHEMLVWYDSSCAAKRFKGIARRFFGHTQSTHQLPTHVEVARQTYGIRPGDLVAFEFEQQTLRGFVNRIHRRATVLVVHPRGDLYSDGQRYRKFYVPLQCLQRVARRA